AFASSGGVGDIVNLQPVNAALVGENQQIGVGGGDDQVLDHILGARRHANAAFAAASLPAVSIDRGALEVAAARHGDGDVFHLHQVFKPDLAGVFDDLSAAVIAEVLLNFFQFLDDYGAQDLFGTEDIEVLGNLPLNVGEFVNDFLLLHAGEALELQFDDGLGLALGKAGAARVGIDHLGVGGGFGGRDEVHQRLAGFARSFRGADQGDHGVEVRQGALEAEQNVFAVAGFAQQVVRAPADDIYSVLDEALESIEQTEFARLAV